MDLRVGIIGAGHMGRVHSQILNKNEKVKLVGVVDPNKTRAEMLASQFKTRVFSSFQQLIPEGVDALYVTTPNYTHFDLINETLREKVHVFCEKPMATSLSATKEILDLVKSTNLICQLGHNYRFAPVYKFAKKLLMKGELTPCAAQIKVNRGELSNPPWIGDSKITGGFLYESAIHFFDMVRWLMGEVEWVECISRTSVYKQADDFAILLTFKSGVIATLFSSGHSTWLFPSERMEIFGKHSTIVIDEMEKVTYCPGLERESITRDYFQCPQLVKWGYMEEDKCFIDSILKKQKPVVSAFDGYKSVELAEACYRSIQGKSRVKLPL